MRMPPNEVFQLHFEQPLKSPDMLAFPIKRYEHILRIVFQPCQSGKQATDKDVQNSRE